MAKDDSILNSSNLYAVKVDSATTNTRFVLYLGNREAAELQSIFIFKRC